MTINIPTPLRTYTAGQASISVDAGTVSTALEALVIAHPGLRANLFGNDGKLRSFVNLYLNEDDIRYLPMKEDSPTSPSDELTIIPSIAGGYNSTHQERCQAPNIAEIQQPQHSKPDIPRRMLA